MGRPLTYAGIEKRLAVRTAYDQDISINHATLRSRFNVPEAIIESALSQTATAWKELLDSTKREDQSQPAPPAPKDATSVVRMDNVILGARGNTEKKEIDEIEARLTIENGYLHFDRTPAKMGEDFIFWVPRVYIHNGLVDPAYEYRVFLKKIAKKR